MESTEALSDVLDECVVLLHACGHAPEATWIEERRVVIASAASSDGALRQARSELRTIVLGMGGLLDLPLSPEEASPYTPATARARLDILADSLYRLTK